MAKSKNKYGSTWWGEQWIRALARLDPYENRIGRGRLYAISGHVLQVNFLSNSVQARVQGSMSRPYKIEIRLSEFNSEERGQIIESIGKNPYFLSKILSRELPDTLASELETKQVRLFPDTWNQLKCSCSCPDYVVPCKHVAAVFYVMAAEMDKNPFVYFELRGIDIPLELKKAGYTEDTEDGRLPIASTLDGLTQAPAEAGYVFRQEYVEQLDFSTISSSVSGDLMRLLKDQPLFSPRFDFKGFLEGAYKIFMRFGEQTLLDMPVRRTFLFAPEIGDVEVVLDYRLRYQYLRQYTGEKPDVPGVKGNFGAFDIALSALPLTHLGDYCPSVQAWYWLRQAAYTLLCRGAFVPKLLELPGSKHEYVVRWYPAALLYEVRSLLRLLSELLPPNSLLVSAGDDATILLRFEDAMERTLAGMSLFLTHWIGLASTKVMDEELSSLFFGHSVFAARGFGREQIPQSIQKWLQVFFLQEKSAAPLLSIEEDAAVGQGFVLSCWVEDKRQSVSQPLRLSEVLEGGAEYADIKTELLRDYLLLAEYVPRLSEVLQSGGRRSLRFGNKEFAQLFLEALPVVRLLGVKVRLPKELDQLIRPRPSVYIDQEGSVGANQSFVNFSELLSFDWRIALGDELLSAAEFKELVGKARGLVKLKGKYVFLNDKEFQELLNKIDKPPKLSNLELLQLAVSGSYEGATVGLSQALNNNIEQLRQAPPVPLPQDLKAQLRPYQQRGYEWLYKNARLGFGSLLADDMGLGKTIQTIAFLLKLKQEGAFAEQRCLAVLPTTLLTNWSRELQRFAPGLSWCIYHGPKRRIDPQADIVLTSYGVLRSDEKKLTASPWKVVLIDEAQNIKNTVTGQTRAVKKLKADCRIALSGTPVENRLSEYWSIFDFVNKGYLGSLKRFTEQFAKPIELERNHETLELFRNATAPFILRRLKTDKNIIDDLPDKVEQDQYCQLTPEQTALYQSVLERSLGIIQGEQDDFSRQGLVLQMITALKQICNHPSQFLKKDEFDPAMSGKMQMLLELLEPILEAGEKVLIFTQYKKMGDLLQKLLHERFLFEPLWLHGGTNRKKRDEMVRHFQEKPYPKVMLLSLKAGGTGLNLTEANHIIHYDLWWNPAVEAQATDRAFRIGQKKNVMVYRFITQNTFEEKINAMIQNKRELADLSVSVGENWVGNLSNEELRSIFELANN